MTKEDIRRWLREGKAMGATHVIVVCDTFDYENFPVFVMPGEDVREKVKPFERGENMTKLMEVYSLALPIGKQLDEGRAFHFE